MMALIRNGIHQVEFVAEPRKGAGYEVVWCTPTGRMPNDYELTDVTFYVELHEEGPDHWICEIEHDGARWEVEIDDAERPDWYTHVAGEAVQRLTNSDAWQGEDEDENAD